MSFGGSAIRARVPRGARKERTAVEGEGVVSHGCAQGAGRVRGSLSRRTTCIDRRTRAARATVEHVSGTTLCFELHDDAGIDSVPSPCTFVDALGVNRLFTNVERSLGVDKNFTVEAYSADG